MSKTLPLEARMRSDIIQGVFAPASRLRMEDLRTRFDVGFSPIREALSRLVGEGLVELEPNRGFRVAPLSRGDLLDIALARVAVETTALRRSIETGDDSWEAGIIAAMHQYRRRSHKAFESPDALRIWEDAHDALHAALIGACGSSRLLSMQRRLQDQHVRYRRLIVIEAVAPEAHIEEHEKLVDLALNRKGAEAVAEIERHMMITVDALDQASVWEEIEKAGA